MDGLYAPRLFLAAAVGKHGGLAYLFNKGEGHVEGLCPSGGGSLTAAFLCQKILGRLIVPHDGFMENLQPLFWMQSYLESLKEFLEMEK